jgi:PAS domain S-box-containing protein
VEHGSNLLLSFIDRIPVMITFYRADTQVLRLNREFERVVGWSSAEAAGISLMEQCYPDPIYREEVRTFMESCREGWLDVQMRTRDGRTIETSWTNIKLDDGSQVGIGFDITARKQAELLLGRRAREQSALYQFTDSLHRASALDQAFQAALDCILSALECQRASILLFDDAGVMNFVAWRGLSDAYRRAVAGHSPWRQDAIDPQPIYTSDVASADIDGALRRTVQEEGIAALAFIPLLDGAKLIGKFMVYDQPHAFADHELALALAIARQLAYSVQAIRAQQDVYRLLGELRAADRQKDQFLATLAHELRNPLAPLRNGLALLHNAKSDQTISDRAREIMDRQVGHMVRLIDDLLDVSRVSRGVLELRKARIDLSDVLRVAFETSRPHLEAAGHTLRAQLPAHPRFVEGDPVRLAQVFANLLNNAALYTPRGGTVQVAVRQEGDTVVVGVEDNGVGIPPEMRERVFEPFVQSGEGFRRTHGGLGLGLSLSRRLLEMHGGQIRIRGGTSGQGTLVEVRLPLDSQEHAAPVRSPVVVTTMTAAPLQILAVDDNRDATESLQMLLRLMGHEIRIAYDGAGALQAAQARKPNLVLVDIGMPDMDGYEVARRLRAQPDYADVAIVAMTGYGQKGDRNLSAAAGIDAHLVKPVELAALEALFAEVPELRARRQCRAATQA